MKSDPQYDTDYPILYNLSIYDQIIKIWPTYMTISKGVAMVSRFFSKILKSAEPNQQQKQLQQK